MTNTSIIMTKHGYLFITLCLVSIMHASNVTNIPPSRHTLHHHIYYWEVYPYLFKSGPNTTSGMLKEITQNILLFCVERATNYKMEFHFYNEFTSYKDYINFIQSNFTKGQGRLAQVTPGSYLWMAPFVSPEIHPVHHQWINAGIKLTTAPSVHVIVKRSWISWKHKLWKGIQNCENYLVLAVLMSICIGALIYLLESRHVNEYGKSLPTGVWNGFWWSFVTMTTVGYGDIVPHSRISRLLSLTWLMFGVLLGSVITATVTDAMDSNNSHLRIFEKKVAVLKHSWERQIASTYDSHIIEKESYGDVLDAVRREEVFAAIINSDVVRWKQKEIKGTNMPLAIIYKIDMTVPIRGNAVVFGNYSIFECARKFSSEIYDTPRRKYHKNIEIDTMDYISLEEMLIHETLGFTLLTCACSIIFIAFVWYVMEKWVFKQKMSFADSFRYFTELQTDVDTPQKQQQEDSLEPHRHTRPSFTIYNHNTEGRRAEENEYEMKEHMSHVEERLFSLEESIRGVNESLQILARTHKRSWYANLWKRSSGASKHTIKNYNKSK